MESIILGLFGLGMAALVLSPFVRDAWSGYDWDGTGVAAAGADLDPALRNEVGLYREALRSGTLCQRCGTANPAGSRFCADCGRPLAGIPE